MVAYRCNAWRNSVVIVAPLAATGVIAVRMIRVVFLVVCRIGMAVTTNMKMRSRCVIFRLPRIRSEMRVRKAKALVDQHQKNEQYTEKSTDHLYVIEFISAIIDPWS